LAGWVFLADYLPPETESCIRESILLHVAVETTSETGTIDLLL
jgi:hypothetical protein